MLSKSVQIFSGYGRRVKLMAISRKNTKSSSFGSPGRINHDSSGFYNSRLYGDNKQFTNISFLEKPVDPAVLNRIFRKSSESMDELPDSGIHLMITSPPYNVSKEYDEDLTLDEYREMLRRVFSETYRVLVAGGRACINIANLGRKPYIPLHSYIIEDMISVGFLMRGEIIWNKGASSGGSTAWGSWMSPSNPCLRDVHEYILVFCKESFSRKPPEKRNKTITRNDFLQWTKSCWEFPAVSAKKIGHPAPFPVELPHRLIQLYTYENEIVLDPFCGSGTTCEASIKDNRNFIGYEISDEYVKLAENRLSLIYGR
jgi:modification methylase